MFKNRMVIIAGATALVLAAGAGAAYAASASIPDSSGVIHGCYKTPVPAHGAPLSVIDSNARGSCPAGSAALNWRQAGADGLTQIQSFTSIPNNTTQTDYELVSNCPSGYKAVGGGYEIPSADYPDSPDAFWLVLESRPQGVPDSTGWFVDIHRIGPFSSFGGSGAFEVWAQCLPTAA